MYSGASERSKCCHYQLELKLLIPSLVSVLILACLDLLKCSKKSLDAGGFSNLPCGFVLPTSLSSRG